MKGIFIMCSTGMWKNKLPGWCLLTIHVRSSAPASIHQMKQTDWFWVCLFPLQVISGAVKINVLTQIIPSSWLISLESWTHLWRHMQRKMTLECVTSHFRRFVQVEFLLRRKEFSFHQSNTIIKYHINVKHISISILTCTDPPHFFLDCFLGHCMINIDQNQT